MLAASYNPSDWNFYRWANANYTTQLTLTVLLGLLLSVAFLIYIAATLRSLGTLGMLLVGAVLAALIWVLID